MNSDRGLGYKADPPDERDRAYPVGVGPHVLLAPDQEAYVQRIRDQAGTSSCVGQSVAGAGEICAAIAGRPCHLSASWPYVIGVEAERPGYRGGLVDDGSFPRLVMQACRARGLLPERARPFSEADVVKRPAPSDAVAAFDASGLRFYRIDAVGEARMAAIEDALRRGFGVLFGMQVDAAYQRNEGDLVTSMGASIGGHMQVVTAVRGDVVRVLNSWGSLWGDRGFANFDRAFFASVPMSDIYAITWVPDAA